MMSRRLFALGAVFAVAACSPLGGSSGSPSSSEVAVSVVSGALNNQSGSTVAWTAPAMPKPKLVDRVMDALSPIGTAWAADWSCTGATFTPAFAGPGQNPYAFTPGHCSVTWRNGRSASSSWSGPFTLSYGASCDATHALMEAQAGGCTLTRTTGADGVARDVTGPDGGEYAITHDTNGAGTGWDSSVSPAPSDGGVVITCASGGCEAGRSLVINGSHLTGTVSFGRLSDKIWDHTVSTGAGGLTVTGTGTSRVVSGVVTVQHNLLRYTATATFDAVGYGEAGCCFPTSGTVSTTFSKGADAGKTESLSFSNVCGEATLTDADGVAEPITLQHCL